MRIQPGRTSTSSTSAHRPGASPSPKSAAAAQPPLMCRVDGFEGRSAAASTATKAAPAAHRSGFFDRLRSGLSHAWSWARGLGRSDSHLEAGGNNVSRKGSVSV